METEWTLEQLRFNIKRRRLDKAVSLCNTITKFELDKCKEKEKYDILYEAVAGRIPDFIDLLLTKGFAVSKQFSQLRLTLLITALNNNDLRTVELLLRKEAADIDTITEDGCSVFRIAIERGQTEIVKLLLSHYLVNVNLICTRDRRPLHYASARGDFEMVKMLIDRGADVNATDVDRVTPLHLATEREHLHIVNYLLKNNADVNFKNRWNYSAIYTAVGKQNVQIIQSLLKYNADTNYLSVFNRNPLHLAIELDNEDIVRELVTHGADVNLSGEMGLPLCCVVSKGWIHITKLLLNHKADKNKCNCRTYNQLSEAIFKRNDEMIELLLSRGFDVNAKGPFAYPYTPLYLAINNGCLKTTKRLLQLGANVNERSGQLGMTPLHLAVQLNKKELKCFMKESEPLGFTVVEQMPWSTRAIEFIELLISHGADVNGKNKSNRTPLMIAIQRRCFEIVKFLLQNRACIDLKCSDITPLYEAIKWDEKIARFLIDKGANVNTKSDGDTILCAVIRSKNLKMFKFLLTEKKADFDSGGTSGRTPLQLAIQLNLPKFIRVLMEFHPDVNITDDAGNAALHVAVEQNNVEMVKHLLKLGARVNEKNIEGHTPLRVAVEKNRVEIAEILLNFRATLNVRDMNGFTDLHIACKYTHDEILISLLDRGSDINITNNADETPLEYCKTRRSKEILIRHIARMEYQHTPVSSHNKMVIACKDKDLYAWRNNCKEEMDLLKLEDIEETPVNLYDLLTNDVIKLTAWARNEKIHKYFQGTEHRIYFPWYINTILKRFDRAIECDDFMRRDNKFCYSPFSLLPYYCIKEIFSYLSDDDIRILISVCKPTNSKKSDLVETLEK